MKVSTKKLKAAMIKACMGNAALAKAAHIGNATVVRILHGDNEVQLSTVGKLSKALNVDFREIVEE